MKRAAAGDVRLKSIGTKISPENETPFPYNRKINSQFARSVPFSSLQTFSKFIASPPALTNWHFCTAKLLCARQNFFSCISLPTSWTPPPSPALNSPLTETDKPLPQDAAKPFFIGANIQRDNSCVAHAVETKFV